MLIRGFIVLFCVLFVLATHEQQSIKSSLGLPEQIAAAGEEEYQKAAAILAEISGKYGFLRHARFAELERYLPKSFDFRFEAQRKETVFDARTVLNIIFNVVGGIFDTSPLTSRLNGAVVVNFYHQVNRALELLQAAWSKHLHVEAGIQLAKIAYYGDYATPIRHEYAYRMFKKIVAEFGETEAMYYLGIIYSNNVGRLNSSAKPHRSTVNFIMAASKNHTMAQMTMAYRYDHGIHVERSCAKSAKIYRVLASKVMEYYWNGPPGGQAAPVKPIRLYFDEETGGYGGLYGPGGQAYSGGGVGHGKFGDKFDNHEINTFNEEETFEYYKYLADSGDLRAQYILGISFYWGTHSMPRHFGRAMRYLTMAANRVFKAEDVESNRVSAHASSIIGKMYLRGEGVPLSNSTALKWFDKGAKSGDMMSLSYRAIIVYERLLATNSTTEADLKEKELCIHTLKIAAKSGRQEAISYLGRYYYSIGSIVEATKHLSHAATHRDMPSMHLLAEIYYSGEHVQESCEYSKNLYKSVVERGIEWIEGIMSDAYDNMLLNPGYGMLRYLEAAERGSEVAQSNLAWALNKYVPLLTRPMMFISFKMEKYPEIETLMGEGMELLMWQRSGEQANGYSRVRAGDIYYYGTKETPRDYKKAFSQYYQAAEIEKIPLGMWSLGCMFHHGLGVNRSRLDAEYYYKKSFEEYRDAWLPSRISLLYLSITSFFEEPKVEEPEIIVEDSRPQDDFTWKDVQKLKRKAADVGAAKKPTVVEKLYGKFSRLIGGAQEQIDPDYVVENDLESWIIVGLCIIVVYLFYVRQAHLGNR